MTDADFLTRMAEDWHNDINEDDRTRLHAIADKLHDPRPKFFSNECLEVSYAEWLKLGCPQCQR